MSLKLTAAMRKKFCLGALLLVLAVLILYLPAEAKDGATTIKVCLKDEQGNPLPGVSVTLKGGANPAGPWKTENSGCTQNKVPLNDNKKYSLEIKADGYKPADESALSLTTADVGSNGVLEKNITLVSASRLSATPTPSPSPSPGGTPLPAQEQTLQQLRQSILMQTVLLSGLGVMLLLVLCVLLWKVKDSNSSIQIIENEVHENHPENLKDSLRTVRESLKEIQKSADAFSAATLEALFAAGQTVGAGKPGSLAPTQQSRTTTAPSQPAYSDAGRPTHSAPPPRVFTDADAQKEYGALIDGGPVRTTPIYLGVEASSSPEDMFGSNRVQLKETPHGTFVLLRGDESEDRGWVFPNPRLAFDMEALKPIFPTVSANTFKSDKKSIRPKQVSQLSAGRWVVG